MTVLLPLDAPRFAIHIFRACITAVEPNEGK